MNGIAASAFTDSDVANNSAAAAAIPRGDLISVVSFLDKVNDRNAQWDKTS